MIVYRARLHAVEEFPLLIWTDVLQLHYTVVHWGCCCWMNLHFFYCMMNSFNNDYLALKNSGYIKTLLLFDSEGLTPNQEFTRWVNFFFFSLHEFCHNCGGCITNNGTPSIFGHLSVRMTKCCSQKWAKKCKVHHRYLYTHCNPPFNPPLNTLTEMDVFFFMCKKLLLQETMAFKGRHTCVAIF